MNWSHVFSTLFYFIIHTFHHQHHHHHHHHHILSPSFSKTELSWFSLLLISPCPCPDPEPDSISVKWMSGKEFWSFDLNAFIEPPPDEPFDFLRRECLGTAGRSCDGKSFPLIEFRCRLECRVLPGESRDGESVDASVER